MRFVTLACLCLAMASLVRAQTPPPALPAHPRLVATVSDFERIRKSVTQPGPLQDAYNLLVATAEREYSEPPLQRVLVGRRMLDTSRNALRRIANGALLYNLTGDKKWAARAEQEMLSLAAFTDWNPSHFLDTAEAATAVAIGYDWTYDTLKPETRRILRDALVKHALKPGDFDTGSWRRSNNNWGQVCETGLALAALIVSEDEPELAARTLARAKRNVPRIFETYEPAGAYIEGPMYWDYGTTYHILLIEALRTATGSSGNLADNSAFLQSASAVNHLTGPSGEFFNYGDCVLRRSFMPAMYWFARETKRPDLVATEHHRVPKPPKEKPDSPTKPSFPTRFLAFALLWMPTEASSAASPMPASWSTQGANPIALFRRGEGRSSLYAGIKGGKARLSHGHMDAGSFILELGGVRWTTDLGMPSYHNLEKAGIRLFNEDRWRVYALGPHSHSIALIDDQLLAENGTATLAEFSAEKQSATIDLTAAYANQVKSLQRTLRVEADTGISVSDTIVGAKPGSRYRFSWMTRANVATDAEGATLESKGKTLRLSVSADTRFEIVNEDAAPSQAAYDEPQPGLRRISILVTLTKPEHVLTVSASLVNPR